MSNAKSETNKMKTRLLGMHQYRTVLTESMQKHLKAMDAGDYDYNVPLFVWGAPGIGKSMILQSICRDTWTEVKDKSGNLLFDTRWINKLRPWNAANWRLYSPAEVEKLKTNLNHGWVLMDVRLSQVDPVEIKGAPMYDYKQQKAGFVRFSSILPDPNFEFPVFLLLDELPLAAEMVQSAAYQLINDRRVGDYMLPERCQIIAAGNRAEDGGVHFEMSPALVNRFDHITVDIDYDGFVKYISNGHGYDETMVAFLQFSKQQDKDAIYKLEPGAGNYPTFRSWEKALRKVKYGSKEFEAIADSVGQGVAARFETFKELTKDIPDAETLVKKGIYYERVELQLVASQKVGNSLLNKELMTKLSEDKAFDYFSYFKDMKNPKDKSDSRQELTILFLVNIRDQMDILDKIDKGFQKAIKAGKAEIEKDPETGDPMKDIYSLIFGKWRSLTDVEG